MGLFSSKSSSTTTTQVSDTSSGVQGGGTSVSAPYATAGGTINVGSEVVASEAIQASKDALQIGTDFLETAFGEVLKLTDNRISSAEANIAATQKFAGELIQKEQESSDDRLIKIVTYAIIAGVAIVAFQSGLFKDIAGVFK